MAKKLKLYNTLERKVVDFIPMEEGYASIYWCGPTTYGPAHLGHARSALVLDLLLRTLTHMKYKVRSVRNITDVGHLVGDLDEGEDKVGRVARLENLLPMEIVQRYMNAYHAGLKALNILSPSIEPRATGHIPEQIALVEKLIDKGFGYVVDGSVYFDVKRFDAMHGYGKLSKREVKNALTGTRPLIGRGKRSPLDFALWKKAEKTHLMRWASPWSIGFPGWHLECTAMSKSYLGSSFDIYGGGIDLCFPHHECGWAQSVAAYGRAPATYWLHHQLVTLAGQKMSKSADHFITLADCFEGSHPLLSRPYGAMIVRLLFLQAHYRSPLDISDHGLAAAEKGYYKLIQGLQIIARTQYPGMYTSQDDNQGIADKIAALCQACEEDLRHDLNTPKVLAHLFLLRRYLCDIESGALSLSQLPLATWQLLKGTYTTFVQDILGLQVSHPLNEEALIETVIDSYTYAKEKKDYRRVDTLRARLRKQGIALQDRAGQVGWQYVPRESP